MCWWWFGLSGDVWFGLGCIWEVLMEVYVCLEGLLVWFILGGWDVNGSLVLVYLR